MVAVDDDAARLTVDMGGDVPVDLPRVDGTYAPGMRAVVVRDPDASGSGQIVVGTMSPPVAPAAELPATGTVTATSASAITVTTAAGVIVCGSIASAVVVVNDKVLIMWDTTGQPWVIGKVGVTAAAPAAPGAPTLTRSGGTVTATWTAVATATSYTVASSQNFGTSWSYKTVSGTSHTISIAQGKTMQVKVAARNSGGASAYGPADSITYPAPAPVTKQYTTTIRCTSSGTWRTIRGAWDRWNVDRWGGARDVYQGDAFGSGELVGFAGYGNQLSGLGAISFDSVVLHVKRNGWNGGSSQSVTVQGCASGSRPGGRPTGAGATATTGNVGTERTTSVALPSSMREALRTGSDKGLITTGSDDAGWYGTGDSFRLVVTYTRYV